MRRRQGFTIVELMVAMALIVFIMAILSQAFIQATGTFRNLKASGDMAEKLRSVTGLLQRELAADHFEGKKRLSNPNFWVNGPPKQGFFRVWHGTPSTQAPNAVEGPDLDGIFAFRSTTHALHFSVRLRGNQVGDFLSAASAPGQLGNMGTFGPMEARYENPGGNPTYNYQWAEVIVFLRPSIGPSGAQDVATDATGSVPGTQLWNLYHRIRLAVPDNSLVQPAQSASGWPASFPEVSCEPDPANSNNLYFNNPTDLTTPDRRLQMMAGSIPGDPALVYPRFEDQGLAGTTMQGADLILNNVISFDVRLLVDPRFTPGGVNSGTINPFVTLYDSPFTAYAHNNPNFLAGNSPQIFDTWSSLKDTHIDYSTWNVGGQGTTIPLWDPTNLRGPIIQAIQITIRIWDDKTSQTRQVTMVQAL
jgi:prepilin-type N-terminal cleavage/methylation domain-containing protein